jgi:hypothetical protein
MFERICLFFGVFATLSAFLLGRRLNPLNSKALKDLGRDIPTLIFEHEKATRRAREYLAKIEEVIAERETWRKLYNDQAGGHENAQALMMQTINALVSAYQNKTGERPKLDPLIEMVRGEWVKDHGPSVRAERLEDGSRPA